MGHLGHIGHEHHELARRLGTDPARLRERWGAMAHEGLVPDTRDS
jgi:hypothetical protein